MAVESNVSFINDTSQADIGEIAFNRALIYSVRLWICICAFVGILFVSRVATSLVYYFRMRDFLKKTRYGVLCIVVNVFRIIFFRVTVSTGFYQWNVAEVCVTLGYLSVLLVWEFVNCYNSINGTTLDVHYWSIRAGVIAMCQLPLLQILSSKNNVITLLTGISYEKLHIFHRAFGRIGLCCVWLHFCGKLALGVGTSGLAFKWRIMGAIAASSYTALFLMSTYPFRKRYYEVFFGLHIILSGLVVIAIYFHVNQIGSFDPTAIPFFVFWAIDRTVRASRTVVILVRSNYWNTSSLDTVQLISESVMLITVHRKMTWKAGQHAFLIVPGLSRSPFEAHPFTIASVPQMSAIQNDEKTLRFIVRAKNGLTKRLQNMAQTANGLGQVRTLIDGPYGIPPKVKAFRNVILIAGGTGVSFTLPLFQSIVMDFSEKSLCLSVTFCWIVSQYEELSWVASQILEALTAAPDTLRLDVVFYISRPLTRSEDLVPEKPDCSHVRSLLYCKFVRLEMRKPNIEISLRQEIENCVGSTLVAVSGPVSLVEDVRRTLQLPSLVRDKEIYLHVETYRIA